MHEYKTMKVGEYCHVPFNKNPMGKIKACIRYAQKVGKYFDITQKEKYLLIRRTR